MEEKINQAMLVLNKRSFGHQIAGLNNSNSVKACFALFCKKILLDLSQQDWQLIGPKSSIC